MAADCSPPSPWLRSMAAVLLLLAQLCSCAARGTSCQILRCNADFVAATLDLGGVEGLGGGGHHTGALQARSSSTLDRGGVEVPGGGGHTGALQASRSWGYCGALRSYGTCTKRTARACRGDLAYHSAVQGIEDLLIQHRCPRAGPTAQPRLLPPPQALPPVSSSPGGEGACLYETRLPAAEYVHCGVFGDPHVRTFADDFQTCTARGAWPLVDNHFLYVQATNTPTGGGGGAHSSTALTKITIIFKSWRRCIEQQIYQAELDNVPAAFTDGSVTSGGSSERPGGRHSLSVPPLSPGGRHASHSLSVHSLSPGRHAEIRAPHIGAVLVVRQSGRSLGLSVRAPRSVAEAFGPEQDVQLCVWGCPASQRIHALPTPPASFSSSSSSSSSTSSAQAHCGSLLPSRDVYYRACVFDVLASGQLNASLAAVAALEDARGMIHDEDRLHLMPLPPPPPPPAPVGAAGRAHRPGIAVLLALSAALLGGVWSTAI